MSLLLGGLLFGMGCTHVPYFRTLSKVDVRIDERSNRETAVALDLVCVYNKALVDSVKALSAQKWFRRKASLRQRHPDGFETWRWEWAAGQNVAPRIVPMPNFTKAVFLFANYRTSGAHRVRVAAHRDLELFFGETSFQARPAP